jgi:hypothetical protein
MALSMSLPGDANHITDGIKPAERILVVIL